MNSPSREFLSFAYKSCISTLFLKMCQEDVCDNKILKFQQSNGSKIKVGKIAHYEIYKKLLFFRYKCKNF